MSAIHEAIESPEFDTLPDLIQGALLEAVNLDGIRDEQEVCRELAHRAGYDDHEINAMVADLRRSRPPVPVVHESQASFAGRK
jgi:hypothetical protein